MALLASATVPGPKHSPHPVTPSSVAHLDQSGPCAGRSTAANSPRRSGMSYGKHMAGDAGDFHVGLWQLEAKTAGPFAKPCRLPFVGNPKRPVTSIAPMSSQERQGGCARQRLGFWGRRELAPRSFLNRGHGTLASSSGVHSYRFTPAWLRKVLGRVCVRSWTSFTVVFRRASAACQLS